MNEGMIITFHISKVDNGYMMSYLAKSGLLTQGYCKDIHDLILCLKRELKSKYGEL
jgi:hypothetical protein